MIDNDKLPRVQHIKRGSTYRVLGVGKIQTDAPLEDYADVVVYQSEHSDQLIWVRPVAEFNDKNRFAATTETQPAPVAADGELDALMDARQKRAEDLHDILVRAREALRVHLYKDSPDWHRMAFDALHAGIYVLSGDPFDMHMRAAITDLRTRLAKADAEGKKHREMRLEDNKINRDIFCEVAGERDKAIQDRDQLSAKLAAALASLPGAAA